MKTFKKHLNDSLKDLKFNEIYNEERKLIELSLKIHEVRKKSGLFNRKQPIWLMLHSRNFQS